MNYFLIIVWTVVTCFFFDSANAQRLDTSVKITSIKVSSTQIDSIKTLVDLSDKKEIRLAFDENYLLFRFVDRNNPAQKSFAYKLTGVDFTWRTCSNCSEVQYAHLDGGDYTFQIKSTTAGAIPATVNFIVEGNIWHRWWFVPMLFLYLLVLIGIGIYFFILFQFRQRLRQQRLIHKEKMTSMAELTAGIAHEIRNPLNFVTNFAEGGYDIINELEYEQQHPNRNPVTTMELLAELRQNLRLIASHGQKASRIVSSMLEHSRITTGKRELTDLNDFCARQLQIAYHEIKAKDPTFSCTLVTDLDPRLTPVAIIPQDISRVLMNLFNNAFYALQQRQKQAPDDYTPTLTVTTQKDDSHVVVRIRDNGTGIPDDVKAKVFQPFFTTKPTGEGTGLGLSLSYDIITKGHEGTLSVESQPGQETIFTIVLNG